MNEYRKIEEVFMTKTFASMNEAASAICKHLGRQPDAEVIKKIASIWQIAGKNLLLFPDVAPSIMKLKREGYKVGLLSNTDCFSTEVFRNAGHGQLFDAMVFSYEAGVLKPNSNIFRIVLNRLGVRPNEAMMVGDNINDDVIAASSLGMDAVLIKRRDTANFNPSHIETRNHPKTISSLYELWDFLK
jgi:HAD superfamily hydrolase (TIGR01509 family)